MKNAIIASATRTPIGRAEKGSLAGFRPDDLCALACRSALSQVQVESVGTIDDVIVGCAQPAGEAGYNLGRAVSLLTDLVDVPGTTVNRYCASSLQALRMAFHAIRAGEGEVFLCAGVETVSRFSRGKADGMPDTRNPRFGKDGLPDLYLAMGETAERVADREGVSRSEMDAFAVLSQQRATAAQASGAFHREITPVVLSDGRILSTDDCPRPGTSLEKLSTLSPVFRPDGRITAGNACPLNDGAAAAVVMEEGKARALGILPRARILGTAVSALNPEWMGLGPVEASRKVLAHCHMNTSDVDLWEMNEAFAAQVVPCARALEIPEEKLNVRGGSIALGHPFGMTGIRLVTTLLHALEDRGGRIGVATLCIGGGQGMALVLERLDD